MTNHGTKSTGSEYNRHNLIHESGNQMMKIEHDDITKGILFFKEKTDNSVLPNPSEIRPSMSWLPNSPIFEPSPGLLPYWTRFLFPIFRCFLMNKICKVFAVQKNNFGINNCSFVIRFNILSSNNTHCHFKFYSFSLCKWKQIKYPNCR